MREHTRHRHATAGALLSEVYRYTSAASRSSLSSPVRPGAPRVRRPNEWIVEAVNLRAIAERAAGLMGARAIYLRHAWPVTDQDARALDLCAAALARRCIAQNPRLVDLDFVEDAVRDWGGRAMRVGYAAHALRLGYSRAHLEFRMAKGPRKQASPSVRYLCDALYLPAVARFEEALERRGIEWH